MLKVVLDCNIFAAAYLENDKWHELGKQIIIRSNEENWKIHEPALFLLEVEQVWLRAMRENRITVNQQEKMQHILFQFSQSHDVQIYDHYKAMGMGDWNLHGSTRNFAMQYGLSFYDAC